MSENESSYYEIALTNKQVVVFFVVLLCFVLIVFLSGVWVGKGDDAGPRVAQTSTGAPLAGDETLDAVQELEFFAGAEDEDLDTPDLGTLRAPAGNAPASANGTGSTLAQDVGSADPVAPPRQAPPAQAVPPRAAPPQAAPPQSATARQAAPATGGFVIQVFSSADRAQAQKVVGQMQGDGHRAVVHPGQSNGQTVYRVRLGPFADRPEAERVADQVKRKFRLDTWITSAGG